MYLDTMLLIWPEIEGRLFSMDINWRPNLHWIEDSSDIVCILVSSFSWHCLSIRRHLPCTKCESKYILVEFTHSFLLFKLTEIHTFQLSISTTNLFGRRMLASTLTIIHCTDIGCRRYSSSLKSIDQIISLRNDILTSSLIYYIGCRKRSRNMDEAIIITPEVSHGFWMWLTVNLRIHAIIIRDGGTVGNFVRDGSGQTWSRTSSLMSFSTLCMLKILILTMLSKKVLLSLVTASFIKPDFMQWRRLSSSLGISKNYSCQLHFVLQKFIKYCFTLWPPQYYYSGG